MKRNSQIHFFIAAATFLIGATTALAHDGIEHVMGTVKTVSATSVTVETLKHETSVIALDPVTKFNNKGAKASAKDLKPGDRVVIDTKDDASDKPHAISLKWGATSPATSKIPAKSVHKMDPNMKM